jgi:hypothetical protein
MTWRDRPKSDRYGITGAFVGMAIAAVVAFQFAFYANTTMRWAIMSAALVGGWGIGRYIGARTGEA